jgi:hypothetical protein
MKPVVRKATAAAIAVLRQATAIAPLRLKASDGLLPSKAHILQNPNSDHNSGLAVDLTHDLIAGINCNDIFDKLQADPRVEYLIFKGKIWSKDKGLRVYKGPNPHTKHLHISIKAEHAKDTSPWFPWLGKPKVINAVKAKAQTLPKKKENK